MFLSEDDSLLSELKTDKDCRFFSVTNSKEIGMKAGFHGHKKQTLLA